MLIIARLSTNLVGVYKETWSSVGPLFIGGEVSMECLPPLHVPYLWEEKGTGSAPHSVSPTYKSGRGTWTAPPSPHSVSHCVSHISGVAGGTTPCHVGLNHKQLYPAVLITRCVDPCAGARNEASNSLPRFLFWLKMILAPISHYSLLTV